MLDSDCDHMIYISNIYSNGVLDRNWGVGRVPGALT